MSATRLVRFRAARILSSTTRQQFVPGHSHLCQARALFHVSRPSSAANDNAAYPPPFSSPPFSVPPPTPNQAPLRPPTSTATRRRLLTLVTFLSGLTLGYVYWQRNNGGFPLDVMKHVQTAQRLIKDADALPESPATEPQRLKLLTQAEQALNTALQQTNTPSPIAKQPRTDQPILPTLPLYIDPTLPPHILALLGSVCQLQGEAKWPSAEQYYLAALRMLMAIKQVEGERLRKESLDAKSAAAGGGTETLDYLDGRMLAVGRQLGGLYTLMRSDVAAEAVLLRCLEMLADVREKHQLKDLVAGQRPINTGSGSSASEGKWRGVSADEYDDDVTAEISEQLSSVFRQRGDYPQAINWTANALKMSNKAANAASASKDDAATDRKVRELHLYTALASDYFSLYLAPPTAAEASRSPTTASPLDNAYHASIHALEALQSLIDTTAQPTSTASNKKSKLASASKSSSSILLTQQHNNTKPTTNQTNSPPMRSAPINLMPSTAHSVFLSGGAVDRLFGLSPSAVRSGLLVEAVAGYSNLASVLCVRGEERDADVAWSVAERAARMTGLKEYMDVIEEQKSMLKSQAHGE